MPNGPDPLISTRVTHSPDDTMQIGVRLGTAATPGTVIALFGGLGAGKTVLTKGIMKGLGGHEGEVTSPTFTLMVRHEARIPLYHIDAYRLTGIKELQEIGVDEAFYSDGVTVIEWAERAMRLLPADRIDVYLTVQSEIQRLIRLEAKGPKAQACLKESGMIP